MVDNCFRVLRNLFQFYPCVNMFCADKYKYPVEHKLDCKEGLAGAGTGLPIFTHGLPVPIPKCIAYLLSFDCYYQQLTGFNSFARVINRFRS